MANPASVVAGARAAFQSGITQPISWRVKQLQRIVDMFTEQEDAIAKAVHADLRKAKHELMLMEIIVCKNEAINAIKNLPNWAKPTYMSKSMLQMMDTIYLQKQPLGVVLVLGAWNYPVQLLILPLIAAIAAGNCVVLKPSEISANTAKIFTHLIPKYLDKECFPVYNGGIPETTELLKERFDHIFYTGSSNVGKIIMAAAAKFLTPVTLELGGKSPVYVDSNTNVNIVARRMLWGKLANSGQTCIAPDYMLCHKDVLEKVFDEIKKTLKEMLGDDPKTSDDYGRIVNDRNFARLAAVIDSMPKEKLVVGGEKDASSRYIAPTVYRDVEMSDSAMKDELFGPILPVIAVSGPDEAIKIINANEKPLALYIFSNTNQVVDQILQETSAGGVCVNDTFMHCSSHNTPFGGVGNSGYGRYHGKWGFDILTHEKPVVWRKQNMESLLTSRYMPYSDSKLGLIRKLTEEKQGQRYCSIM